jgi:hypothetical protein
MIKPWKHIYFWAVYTFSVSKKHDRLLSVGSSDSLALLRVYLQQKLCQWPIYLKTLCRVTKSAIAWNIIKRIEVDHADKNWQTYWLAQSFDIVDTFMNKKYVQCWINWYCNVIICTTEPLILSWYSYMSMVKFEDSISGWNIPLSLEDRWLLRHLRQSEFTSWPSKALATIWEHRTKW